MIRATLILANAMVLSACVTTETSTSSSKLPAGDYTMKGFSSDGQERGLPMQINVPASDPDFAVGALCSNQDTLVVKAINSRGEETLFQCGMLVP